MHNCDNNNHDLLGSFKEAGIKNNLKDAIEDLGVLIPSNVCLCDYPEIIRKNLTSKKPSSTNIEFKDSDTVSFEVDNDMNVYAKIECITFEQIDAL